MEDQNVLDNSGVFGSEATPLVITPEIRNLLRNTAWWTKLVAIIGLVFMILFIIVILAMGGTILASAMEDMPSDFPIAGFGTFMFIFYGAIFALGILFMIWLLRFASNIQKAVNNDDQAALLQGFKYLNRYYRVYGILTLIGAVIYGLAFLLGIIGIMAAGL